MALDAATLKNAIEADVNGRLDTLFADPEAPPARAAVWQEISEAIATQVVDHIVANLEIKGITVNAGTPINTVVTAGVPVALDGGAGLKTTMLAAALPTVQGIQDNDGTGLVA